MIWVDSISVGNKRVISGLAMLGLFVMMFGMGQLTFKGLVAQSTSLSDRLVSAEQVSAMERCLIQAGGNIYAYGSSPLDRRATEQRITAYLAEFESRQSEYEAVYLEAEGKTADKDLQKAYLGYKAGLVKLLRQIDKGDLRGALAASANGGALEKAQAAVLEGLGRLQAVNRLAVKSLEDGQRVEYKSAVIMGFGLFLLACALLLAIVSFFSRGMWKVLARSHVRAG